jgi:transcriptional regulator with XRE-family HTH domain
MTVMRSVAGITMQQLADLVGCSRMSLQQIELGRLELSHKMAEKVSLHTGIGMNWLLAGKHKVPPVCQRDPNQAFTREIYRRTRADINRPRADPMDVAFLRANLAAAYQRLNAVAEVAYRDNKIIYFYYQLREFLEALEKQWPPLFKEDATMDVAQTSEVFRERFEKGRRRKRASKPGF